MSPDRSKVNLRLPSDLYAEAASLAQHQGISLNAFLTMAVRNWVTYQKRGIGASAGLQPTTLKAPPSPVSSGNVGRNDPCPCGSGRKFKVCHGKR